MLSLASVLAAYVAVAAVFAARPRSQRRPSLVPPRARPAMYALAIGAVVAATALWPPGDGAVMTTICVVLAVSVAATLFVLLEPFAPRLVWGLAAAAPVAAAALAIAG